MTGRGWWGGHHVRMNDALACARCGVPVERNAHNYETFEKMHWLCFHLEYEHRDSAGLTRDPDIACGDPGRPARAFDAQAGPDWFRDHR